MRFTGPAILFFAATITSVSLLGCSNEAPTQSSKSASSVPVAKVAPGQEMSLLPLDIGNQWSYTVNVDNRGEGGKKRSSNEVTIRVVGLEPTGEGKKATLEIAINKNNSHNQTWLVDRSGIYHLTMGSKEHSFIPQKPLVKFPIKSDETFKWQGKGPAIGQEPVAMELTSVILSPQEIDTEKGRFSAIPVETIETWRHQNAPGKSLSTAWWVPNVGLARLKQVSTFGKSTCEQIWILKNYTVKDNVK